MHNTILYIFLRWRMAIFVYFTLKIAYFTPYKKSIRYVWSKNNVYKVGKGLHERLCCRTGGHWPARISRIEKDQKPNITDELLDSIAQTLGVSKEDIKSPTPIIMHFHNSPNSGLINSNSTYNESDVVKILQQQIAEKDKQIAELLAVLKK